jgi:hypothetical protein
MLLKKYAFITLTLGISKKRLATIEANLWDANNRLTLDKPFATHQECRGIVSMSSLLELGL